MTLFATFDGAKAVGKSTLILEVQRILLSEGHRVDVLVEKDLLPEEIKLSLESLYDEHRKNPGSRTDAAIADLLLQGRVYISGTALQSSKADVVLMDRWYPSDAVFRRYIDVEKAIDNNVSAGVRVPDAVFAVLCDPVTSWSRAHKRSRSLDSKVIQDFEGHVEASKRFENIVYRKNWHQLHSDAMTPRELAEKVKEVLFLGRSHCGNSPISPM